MLTATFSLKTLLAANLSVYLNIFYDVVDCGVNSDASEEILRNKSQVSVLSINTHFSSNAREDCNTD